MEVENYTTHNDANYIHLSKVPDICKLKPCVLGIDEAGRFVNILLKKERVFPLRKFSFLFSSFLMLIYVTTIIQFVISEVRFWALWCTE